MAPKRPALEPASATAPVASVEVWATDTLVYCGSRVRPGWRFDLLTPEDFDPARMSRTGDPNARKVTFGLARKPTAKAAPATLSEMAHDNPLGA